MLPDRVSNPGPLTYESGALPIALRGPASFGKKIYVFKRVDYQLKFPAPLKLEQLLFISKKN